MFFTSKDMEEIKKIIERYYYLTTDKLQSLLDQDMFLLRKYQEIWDRQEKILKLLEKEQKDNK